MLQMIHPDPDIAGTAEIVNIDQYRQIYAPRGWVLLGPAETFAAQALGKQVASVEDLTVDELRAVIALRRNAEYPQASAKKPAVLKALQDSFADEVAAQQAAIDGGAPTPTAVAGADDTIPAAPATNKN
jgi:hypothetical protein